MSVSARLIRRRIKSVGNTKKITKAMELVSAAKMRRAVALATSARRYEELGNALLGHLSHLGAAAGHPLCGAETPGKKALCIVIASDRGLCGAYNVALLRSVLAAMAEYPEADYIVCGRFAETALRRAGKNVIASFSGLTNVPQSRSIRPIAAMAAAEFGAKVYGSVWVAGTRFVSALRQTPAVSRYLPVAPPDRESPEAVGAVFEPDPGAVMGQLLPRFLEARMYQAVLEAAASEHSARMMSMRSATDAAAEMVDDLTFTLNQARQSAITSEIAEISAGRAALEG
jgi:F-type H+-transporting ATPase subunit gamma